jgi:multiple sugar transport system permease protein
MTMQQRLNQSKSLMPMQKTGKLAKREAREFYIFVMPWIIGLILFDFGPIVASFVIGLTDWSLLDTPSFIGLQNFVTMFKDPLFFTALWNSAYYGFFSVGLGLMVSFSLALLLNQKVVGMPLFRTIFYLPSVVSGIAVALLWSNILHPDFGLINTMLSWIGIKGPGWLSAPAWSKPSLILMSLWAAGGSMVIYLAGLQSVPAHLYEAAEIDGAGPWQKFKTVTVPMMSPVIFYNLIVGVIASLQNFVLVLIMTQGLSSQPGGPANSTMMYGLYLYLNAFSFLKMGYASALAWVLLLIIMVITAIQFRLARTWVFYEGEAKN